MGLAVPGLPTLQNPMGRGKGRRRGPHPVPSESWSVLIPLQEKQEQVIPPTVGHPNCRVDAGNQSAFSGQRGEIGCVGVTLGTPLVCIPRRNLTLQGISKK